LINWFKKDIYKGYKGILKNAFPKSLEEDLKIVLKVIPFSDNNIKLTDGNFHKVDNLIFENSQIIKVGNEDLTIPYRVYFNEPNQLVEKLLTVNQQKILNCIYLRHHNGFVRQKRLEKLKAINEYWITPYLFQLLGEYVIEILEVIDKQHNNTILDNFKQFKLDNPKYFIQTESRMISYWNQYYRRNNTKLNSYVGRLLFNKIKMKVIGLDIDEIIDIAIDEKERLLIKPKNTRFRLIYRTATEVHWDEKLLSLYSPKPREWTYLNWYQHIINVVEVECNTKLILTARTKWTNISNELKKTINRK
jgi:Integron Cassette Protein Hfx_Cass5